jgi:uncharacterized membrane protein YbhN (UPF0104 family)
MARRLVTLAVLAATAVIVCANRRELPLAWRALRHAGMGWFVLALILAAAGLEVSLAAVLVSFGVPLGVAGAAVVSYRAVEFWFPLGVGALAVHHVTPRKLAPSP